MCSKIELPPGYCWTKAGLQPSYSQATARLPPAVFANCTTCSRKKLSMLNPQLVAGEHGFFGAHGSEDIQIILNISR